jgi:hypothetical protein
MSKEERYKVENALLVGLWYGNKPDMNIFMSSLVSDLLLMEKGIPIQLNGDNILIRGRIIGEVMDLPARADYYRTNGHNGKCSCLFCNTKGKCIDRRMCFATPDGDVVSQRTEQHVTNTYEMLRSSIDSDAICGLKDIPVMTVLPYWSMLKTNYIDGMHQIQGIFKSLIKLWSLSKYKTYNFHIKKRVWQSIDNEYKTQKNVAMFKRSFRSLLQNYKHMKAMEALVFMIYSSPILEKYMDQKYYKHHELLVDSLTKLFSEELSYRQLDMIEKNLKQYVLEFQVCVTNQCFVLILTLC